ncbi:CRTAC1 family protein [Loktanella agnita]|uniref:CRTAC1 family protein n=1 Tax=Loktanella agnita TaxID=287097 RepID=UPI003987AA68
MIRALSAMLLASSANAQPIFENHSDALPPHEYTGGWEHFVGGGVAVLDCNGDALPDIFAAGGDSPAALFRNDGSFKFTSQAIPQMAGVTGAYPLDINADGLIDLFVMRVGANRVLRGNGACLFIDVTEAWLPPGNDQWTTAFTAWWEDDSRPVMAVGNYVDRSNPDGPFEACDSNQILRPAADTYESSTLTPAFCPLSMLAARDARGRSTLRISNDRHYYVRGGYEQMWDIGEGRFLGPEDGWQNVSLWGMGIASRDLTGDGRDEVMLTSMGDQLMQIANPDGTYDAAPYEIGTYAQRPHTGDDGRPSTGWHAEFGDVNNDGRPDLFIAKGNVDQMPGLATRDPNNLLMQNEDGTFTETASAAGIATTDRSRGAAFADFDADGRLDLIVVNRRAPLELYRNISPNTGNWVKVSLQQPGGNRFAVGAQVTVQTANGSQLQQITVGGGHAGGKALPLHFGIGDADHITVTVEWPDGTQQTFKGDANTALSLSRE